MGNLLMLLVELLLWLPAWRIWLSFLSSVAIMGIMHAIFPGQSWVWYVTLPIVVASFPLGAWWQYRSETR